METIKSFHGSHSRIDKITENGTFEGIFGASEKVAESHGKIIHVITSKKHLTDYELNYEIENAWEVALDVADYASFSDEVDLEDIARAILRADCEPTFSVDAEQSWELQKIRGKLAKKLGFTSVEMKDEHGTVTLFLSNCKIEVKQ
jgi:hypothetical protein